MKIAIMQPYFFPYIGYFQLMNAVDEFVVYDNIEFSKKGWISRNRILVNGKDVYISLPLKKDSDYLDVRDRYLADVWESDRSKMLNRVIECYRKAPEFKHAYPVVEHCILFDEKNLFKFLLHSLNAVKEYLNIATTLVISSSVPIDHQLKGDKRVIELCRERKASQYINPIGGVDLYKKEDFKNKGIDLCFLKASEHRYLQLGNEFVPWLSIIDVMMFNTKEDVKKLLEKYSLQ